MLSYNLAHMVICGPSIIYAYASANNYFVVSIHDENNKNPHKKVMIDNHIALVSTITPLYYC